MFKREVLLLVVAFIYHTVEGSIECVNVETSEGPVTLQNGGKACAPLEVGQTEEDKGSKYVTCSQGTTYIQPCNRGLRFDVVTLGCNWPGTAKCRLPAETTQGVTTTPAEPTPSTAAEQTRTGDPSNPLPSTTNAQSPTNPTTRQTTQPQPTGPCNSQTCRLPNCFCYGARPNIPLKDTPMFIMLTFDDAVTTTVYSFFKSLLVDNSYNILNPDGCPIRSAFYVNHQYTDYSLVKALADKGNEIASHTIDHLLPSGESSTDYPEAVAQINGMREKVLQGTGSKNISDSMCGFRAPYLRTAYDVQFDALSDSGFLYDTSITNIETFSGRPPLWPYTLDYVMPRCTNLPCPARPHPGLWEVPINGWIGSDNYSCSMIDVCSVGTNIFTASEQEWYSFYKRNFVSYFYPLKVPMQMFTHGSMFLRSPPSYPALISWFQDLQLTHYDVWIVTPKMVLDWMRNPIPVSQMIAEKWGCS